MKNKNIFIVLGIIVLISAVFFIKKSGWIPGETETLTVTSIVPVKSTRVIKAPKEILVQRTGPKKTPFEASIDAMATFDSCKEHTMSLQECIKKISQTHYSSGFKIMDATKETTIAEYLTVRIKDEGSISINYKDKSVLLGTYEQLKDSAKKGNLPQETIELLSLPVEPIL